MFRSLARQLGINPFDRLLKKAQKKGRNRFLVCWNRGLGDIALGMYALIHRMRQFIPDARITVLTRADLYEGFQMLDQIQVFSDPSWKRGFPFDLDSTLKRLGLQRTDFDLILEKPDPTQWLRWQLGQLVPQLRWDDQWDRLHEKFSFSRDKCYVGVHVQTETSYGYEKNWPFASWNGLFEKLIQERGMGVILFGFAPTPAFDLPGIVDLRGKTQLLEMLSIIKNCCTSLVVPDSGVLSLTYYLNRSFPLRVVSLWADPKQGILKQNVPSPNPHLVHCPLIAPQGDLRHLTVEQVWQSMAL